MSVCTTTQNFYKGDGVTTNYPFTFEYPADRPDFVKVALWDETTNEYLDTTDWTFDGPTIVKFNTAPPPPPTVNNEVIDNIRIYRVTDVDPLEATFYPGSAIKADDLNDTFVQLQNSIQEIQCYDGGSGYTGDIDILSFYLKRANDSILGYIDNESNVAFRLPAGATADRPVTPKLGDARYNTTINKIEFYESTGWTARDSDISDLFKALPADGSPITSGEALVPIVFPDGLQLPDQTSPYAVEGAIRVNLSNEKLEVYLDGDWTTASAGAEVGSSPPSPSTQGDVWWDSVSGRAYVYYNDADSSQWVEMNPSWNGSVADGVVTPPKLSPGGPSWDTSSNFYVEGNAYVGGSLPSAPNISLNADGSAEFENYIQVNSGPGYFKNTPVGGDGQAAYSVNDSSGTRTFEVKNDGASFFDGLLTVNDRVLIEKTSGSALQTTNGGTTRCTISSTGSITNYDVAGTQMCQLVSDGTSYFASDGRYGVPNDGVGSKIFFERPASATSDNVFIGYDIANMPDYVGNENNAFAIGNIGGGGKVNILTFDDGANRSSLSIYNKHPSFPGVNAQLFGNGDAEFTGIVGKAIAYQTSGYTDLGGVGAILTSAGAVYCNRPASNPTASVFLGRLDGVITSNITAEGNATFEGKLYSDDELVVGYSAFPNVKIRSNGIINGYKTNGSSSWTFSSNGDAVFTGTVTATVVPPSDVRFKENITPAKPQLADVVALGGMLKNYDWNDKAPVNDALRNQRQLGLVAQEVETVCPGLVKDIGTDEDSYKGISTDALIMKLIGAVTELQAEVQSLKGGK